ncbi:MAG: hypothetical protein RL417_2292 [Pseudomonadota bacterium]|jgi:prevent-host-death family protein
MKAVGIKALKARLSEYLRLVKAGEVILVTERDEVVAELRPARRQGVIPDDIEATMQELADKGVLTLRSNDAPGWPGGSDKLPLKGLDIERIMKALRGR